MKYLIVGTGGVGGSIAAFLALAGKDVTCIARGEHLKAMQEKGLQLKSDLKGEHTIPIKACEAEKYTEKADVIFVCVKGYSIDSILQLIRKASHQETIVIPILNVYGTGPRLQRSLPGIKVLDGCIYIVGFVSGKGEITQMGKIFRLVFGAHKGMQADRQLLKTVQKELQESGIKADLSEDINRDTFVKWSFISAMACTGAYYNVPMGEVQKKGEVRNTFIGLSTESAALGKQLGITFEEDLVTYNLKVIDKLDPESTASMQKDMAKGHESEVQGLLFDMIAQAKKHGIDTPTYRKIASRFEVKSEKEKMLAGEPYNGFDPQLIEARREVKLLLHKLNVTEYYTDKFEEVIHELLPNAAKSLTLEPPFHCDYGEHIYIGENVFINFGAVILDCTKVTIGSGTFLAPGVHIYAAEHPLDAKERAVWENGRPVTIGKDCWIGGHTTICPGVTIGDRSVIGAGSVVTKDIPADSLAVGNPARIIRKLNQTKEE